jgi:murein DD-endopeptidase MepM/ murein hydrolase activator NlpD
VWEAILFILSFIPWKLLLRVTIAFLALVLALSVLSVYTMFNSATDFAEQITKYNNIVADTISDPQERAAFLSYTQQTLPSNQFNFIKEMAPSALQVEKETGIPASDLLSIMAHETGWGVAVRDNNYFGIKATGGGWTGPSFFSPTWEDYGTIVQITDRFRSYSSPLDSMRDFVRFLLENHRYDKAIADFEATGDPDLLIRGIHQAGYATDRNWSDLVIALRSAISAQLLAAVPIDVPNSFPLGGHEWFINFEFNKPYTTTKWEGGPDNHRGIDIVMKGLPNGGKGQPYTAFYPGVVVAAGPMKPPSGNGIIIWDEVNGLYHRYFHNDAVLVSVGQRVTTSTQIGILGDKGTPNAPHLHYEVAHGADGDPLCCLVDPHPFFEGRVPLPAVER